MAIIAFGLDTPVLAADTPDITAGIPVLALLDPRLCLWSQIKEDLDTTPYCHDDASDKLRLATCQDNQPHKELADK